MNRHASAAPTTMKPPHDCGCGCGGWCGCDTRCCDLECLVRPNFFCGQLLTDADITALVDWTRSRSRCRATATAGASSAGWM